MSAVSRRPILLGLMGLAAVAAAGGLALEVPKLFRPHYPPTPYDDLLAQLPDRESAIKLGRAALASQRGFDAAAAAHGLRTGPGRGVLAHAVEDDIATGRLREVQGWLLPVSLVQAAALAAAVTPPAT